MTPYPQPPPKKNFWEELQGGFTYTLAAMISLLTSPVLNEWTQPWVIWLASKSYSPEWVDVIAFLWLALCFPFTFFLARAGTIAAISLAGIYLAYRLI